MSKILNVMYQSDNNYAPQTGVSITSLFENNKHFDSINIFLLNDNIAEDNLQRLSELCTAYNRNLNIVDTTHILSTLIDLGVEPFRGTYTTYFKLLAISEVDLPTDRLLQIDGDTIINEPLDELLEINLDNFVCAATNECVQNEYKDYIGLNRTENYYNCGVLLINQLFWKEYQCKEKILNHLSTVRNRYFTVDQDIINVLFRDKIKYLAIKFNLNSGFYIYGVKESFYIYDLNISYYVSPEEISCALKKPYINHCMGPMTGRPWEQDNIHPQNELYNHYLALSPWKNIPKIAVQRKGLFYTQRKLYQILPLSIYARIHKMALRRYLRKMNKNCLS